MAQNKITNFFAASETNSLKRKHENIDESNNVHDDDKVSYKQVTVCILACNTIYTSNKI